ncbi:hypothetical protein CK203_044159 [Vitis vinifera]|uniref:Uncharacterized protein n=1 Tax=Vitis vinifera TaxID=29760 RepID=A0A438I2V7_VITVI|nr:hypothetical protein CK203_044159 [Vitis vinifera]
MTTLHGSAPSLLRRTEGCVPPEGMIASARDHFKVYIILLEPPCPVRVERSLVCFFEISDMGQRVVTVDQFMAAMASIQRLGHLRHEINSQQMYQAVGVSDVQQLGTILRVIRGLIRGPRGKFRPNWSRPYFIRELTLEGAAWLMDLDGNRFSKPTNVDQLKDYYV